MWLLLVVVGLVAGLGHAQVISLEKCPEFIPKVDFQVERYLGKWFEIARFPNTYEIGQRCNYAEYSDNGDGTVKVHNGGLNADGVFTEIFGYVEQTDVPGALLLHLDGVPFVGQYNVLETDYTNYATVYTCTDIFGISHVEQAWILARTPSPTPQALQNAFAAFAKWGINTEPFLYTAQEDCANL
ncbi:apolipoprotein D-like [Panulirus ornatus]|uniref:apolipoprotein D-like n=1 Tax=Panulirus ornatus TaxID=150431 RepID=UPI003A89D3D3